MGAVMKRTSVLLLASACAGGSPPPAAAPSSPEGPSRGTVHVRPAPDETIELVGDDGKRSVVVHPKSASLWSYFDEQRVEIWTRPCPPSLAKGGGVCADHWRHAEKGGDYVEVGPEQTYKGRFVEAAGPKGSKREGEKELRFRWGDSELLAENVGDKAPRDREVTIRARVLDVQAMKTYAMVMGPRLWGAEIE